MSRAEALFPPRVVLFACLLGWILYAWVDMRLVFQMRDGLFLLNFDFAEKFLARPGALMDWTDRLLVQWCYWGWPAVIAVAAAAWLLLTAAIALVNAIARTRVYGTWIVPAMLVTALCSQYGFRASKIVALALAIIAANGWARTSIGPSFAGASGSYVRLAAFAAISIPLYYVVGPAYCVFAACAAIYEALSAKRPVVGVCCLVAAVAVKFGLDSALARIPLDNFYVAPEPFNGYGIEPWRFNGYDGERLLYWGSLALYAYFPVCAALVALRPIVGPRIERAGIVAFRSAKVAILSRSERLHWALRWMAATMAILAAASAIGWWSVERGLRSVLAIDYCAEHQSWPEVLAKARQLPPALYSPSVNHDVDLALYHTGRLPYDMFTYSPVALPLLTYRAAPWPALMRKPFDLLLEMGRVNEAEHIGLEMLEVAPSGGTLKRLALVKMVKGQTAAARVVLNVLRDDLVWGRWAQGYLQRIEADPTLAADAEIQAIRGQMIADDGPPANGAGQGGVYAPLPVLLQRSLEKDGGKRMATNRMALEYLLAIFLIERNVHDVTELLSHLGDTANSPLPPPYETAVLIDGFSHPEELETRSDGVYFHGRRISDASVNEFGRFKLGKGTDNSGGGYLGYYFHKGRS